VQTIDQLIHDSCQKHPDRVALRHKTGGIWRDLTYRTLWSTIESLAAGLSAQGLSRGGHAALLAPSSPRWVEAYLAILRLGAVAVPIDKELKTTELKHILNDSDSSHVFVGSAELDRLLEIVPELPTLKKIIVLDNGEQTHAYHDSIGAILEQLTDAWRDLTETVEIPAEKQQRIESLASESHRLLSGQPQQDNNPRGEKNLNFFAREEETRRRLLRDNALIGLRELSGTPPLPAADHRAEACAVILYTSGTTGRSKGAMLSHFNIVSNILGASRHFSLDQSISTLSFLPINHVFEQVCGILLPLSLGGRVAFAESIKKLGDNLGEIRPTFLLGVPAVYRLLHDRIMKTINAKSLSRTLFRLPLTRKLVSGKIQQSLGRQTIFVSGGAALDPAIATGFKALGLTLLQGYGITETSPVLAAESPDRLKPGTVGLPLDNVDIRIDQPNPEGVGEILARGPNIMLGYYKNPQATAEVLSDGWYRTGDLGRINSDDTLSICGRVKNLIVTPNGKNVYPEEVENELLHSPYIAEAMVYGHKVSATAEEVYAAIYPNEEQIYAYEQERGKGPLTAAELDSLIRSEVLATGQQLADYKRIKKFILRSDEFPKTTTKKIKRYAVEPQSSQTDGADGE